MALILVADDSWLTRQMVGKVLQSEGYDIIEAVNGKEAVDTVETCSPDCVLLDLLMPELDGFGVLQAFAEKGLLIPVIVLSADIQETSREKCLSLGAAAIINKPPKDLELLGAIRAAVHPSEEAGQ
jgi:CheY-like chemotaxis protein